VALHTDSSARASAFRDYGLAKPRVSSKAESSREAGANVCTSRRHPDVASVLYRFGSHPFWARTSAGVVIWAWRANCRRGVGFVTSS
jgi:hypothetical protein